MHCRGFIHARNIISVLRKPRAFSSQRARQGSSRGAGPLTPGAQRHRSRMVVRVGIERMRTGRQHQQRVHLEAQLDVVARAAVLFIEMQCAGVVGGHAAEEIDVGNQVALAEAILAELVEHAVAAVLEIVVALFLETAGAELCRNHGRIRQAADSVVPAAAVGGNRAQYASHIRIARAAGGQKRGVLRLERIGQVVALRQRLEVVHQRCDIGARLERRDAQRRAAPQDAGPVLARSERLGPQIGRRLVWRAAGHGSARMGRSAN